MLGALLIMLSFPAALMTGAIGILRDTNKLLAIITTIVAAALVLFYVFSVVAARSM